MIKILIAKIKPPLKYPAPLINCDNYRHKKYFIRKSIP